MSQPKPPPASSPPPPPLPAITAPKAVDVCVQSQPSPAAQALLTSQQTPTEHLQALQDHKLGEDAVRFLAHGLPEQKSVVWATQSGQQVAGQLPPADKAALQAADAYTKHPTPATQAAAGAAAAKTGYQGPGAWAAQAAAWSKPVPATPAAPPVPGAPTPPTASTVVPLPNLTPHAVVGAVMLSAATAAKAKTSAAPAAPVWPPEPSVPTAPQLATPKLPPTPEQQAKSYEALKPFIELGKKIASGKNTWA